MEQEQAIDKIKKLLRLSESPNEHEAQVALKKARELMLQYHITEASLDTQDKETIWKEIPLTKKWMTTFYTIIAHNNRCDCYHSKKYEIVNGKLKLVRKMHIVGYAFDVECVVVMAQLVEDTVKAGIAHYRKTIRSIDSSECTKGVTQSYVYGFRRGLQQAFNEQNAKQEFHLMCITPKEVEDEMNSVPNLKTVREHFNLGYSASEVGAVARGHTDGYQTGLRKQIETA